MSMGIGEALVSTLDEKGQPSIVQQTFVKPPSSQVGPIPQRLTQGLMEKSPVAGIYDDVVDRESAHEILQKRTEERAKKSAETEAAEETAKGDAKRPRGLAAREATASGRRSAKPSSGQCVPMATRVLEDVIRRNALGGHSAAAAKPRTEVALSRCFESRFAATVLSRRPCSRSMPHLAPWRPCHLGSCLRGGPAQGACGSRRPQRCRQVLAPQDDFRDLRAR